MIDVISGGRLIAGFPVGTPMDTCFAYGQNPSMLRDRYHEAHDLVVTAWTEPDTFAFNGRFNQQRYVNIWPRPIQKPHPPIWIPGGGSVETWRWCAADGPRLRLPVLFRLQGRAGDDGRVLGRDGPARQGPEPVPCRLSAIRRRRREPRGGLPALPRAGRIFLRPLSARRPALRRCRRATPPRRPSARGVVGPGRRSRRAAGCARFDDPGTRDGRDRREGLRDHRLARRGRRAAQARWRPISMSAT